MAQNERNGMYSVIVMYKSGRSETKLETGDFNHAQNFFERFQNYNVTRIYLYENDREIACREF